MYGYLRIQAKSKNTRKNDQRFQGVLPVDREEGEVVEAGLSRTPHSARLTASRLSGSKQHILSSRQSHGSILLLSPLIQEDFEAQGLQGELPGPSSPVGGQAWFLTLPPP